MWIVASRYVDEKKFTFGSGKHYVRSIVCSIAYSGHTHSLHLENVEAETTASLTETFRLQNASGSRCE
ncbi:4236_t:CDS:2 [Paraglomus brasilianum]|uniref:4236_t:CDS:1 n=1 Tax=Paraglomus brasilianum TaxID=144538 RepID=A0A9N9GRI6_9GLOM|nr:4236_t:CDS:2 [Paraglomus brasilianum]